MRAGSLLLLFIAAGLVPRPAGANSKFRLVDARVEGKDAVFEVALTHQGTNNVDFFAHDVRPRHTQEDRVSGGTYKGPLIREGLAIGSIAKPPQGDSIQTFRVPLAEAKTKGIEPGKEVFVAANWPGSGNSGQGHQWGAVLLQESARITQTSCVLKAAQNSRLGLHCRVPRWGAPRPRALMTSPWRPQPVVRRAPWRR